MTQTLPDRAHSAPSATAAIARRTYPAYRDSGMPWLGQIPAHWEITRADAHLRLSRVIIDPSNLGDTTVFHYSIPVLEETGDGRFENSTEIDSAKLLVHGGEVLVSKLNPRKSRVLITQEHSAISMCSPEFVVLEPLSCDVRFAAHLYASEPIRQYLAARVDSVTRSQQRVRADVIAKLWAAWPPP